MESPYQLRLRPNPKRTEFSDSIARVAKALSVIRLEEDKEEEEPLIAQLQLQPETISVQQAMQENPLKWQVAL